MGNISIRLIIICLILYQATHFWPGMICYAQNVTAVFVFGDSLLEAGNNYYINSYAQPYYPNGIDFSRGSPSGRYTNNRLVTDIIEEELGFKNYAPPYLAPNTTGDLILKGVNYASAASGILNSTGWISERIGLDQQVNYFAKTRQDIIRRIGSAAAQRLLRNALYFLGTGANDIVSIYFSIKPDVNNRVDDIVSNYKSLLTKLYNLGARKIAVTNSPFLGCIPFMKDIHLSVSDCVSTLNDIAKAYNSRLKSLLQELTTDLPGSTFAYIDFYAIMEDIIQNYKSYGFENADIACCQVIGLRGGIIPCGALSRVCPDRSKYVFWDPFHLTDSAHQIMAKRILDGGLEYVSPINIRQMVNS